MNANRERWILKGLLFAYVLAGSGLVLRVAIAPDGPTRLMAVALLLFCLDLTRMALVDLGRWFSVRCKVPHSQLPGFSVCLGMTIAIELAGLYCSWIWLGGGMALVMASQLWFNGVVRWSLHPQEIPPIRPWPIAERFPVLIADCVALALTVWWMVADRPALAAIALLAMAIAYLAIKYGPTVLKALR